MILKSSNLIRLILIFVGIIIIILLFGRTPIKAGIISLLSLTLFLLAWARPRLIGLWLGGFTFLIMLITLFDPVDNIPLQIATSATIAIIVGGVVWLTVRRRSNRKIQIFLSLLFLLSMAALVFLIWARFFV